MTDAKTFDLMAALAGRSYPTEKVTVFLDEELMYEFSKARYEADHDPANAEKQDAVDKMAKVFADAALTVTVKGVPPHVVKQIALDVEEKFPIQVDAFNRMKPNPERGEEFSRRFWSVYVVQIAQGDATMTPSTDDLDTFRDEAPEAAIKAIDEAISKLRDGAEDGYNKAVSDPAFLSMR